MRLFGQAILLWYIISHYGVSATPTETSFGGIEIEGKKNKVVAGVDDVRHIASKNCALSASSYHRYPKLSNPLDCARTCNEHEPSRTCYYHFVVEYYTVQGPACELCKPNATNTFCNNCECVPADGVERSIMTVNRMIPGPSIQVCQGDRVVIDVENLMHGSGLTIHWHGIFQKGSQHYDGAELITQCPIPEQTTFRYQWVAENAGTHFWHAHTGLQKMDGIFGSLIVRQSAKEDVHRSLYNYDLSPHTVVINDWMHEPANSRFPGRSRVTNFQYPDNALINGKGRYEDQATGSITTTDIEVFTVRRGNRYRFRLVNAFCTVCPSILTVQGHNLTVIEVDGVAIKPVVVTSIVSSSGERFDFVINANQRVDAYWIQLRLVSACRNFRIQQLAVLRYEGGPKTPRIPKPTFDKPLKEGVILNPLDAICDNPDRTDAICISNLRSAVPVDKGILGKPDVQVYMPFSFYGYERDELFQPNVFKRYIVAPAYALSSSLVSGISFLFPPAPLLTQIDDVPPEMLCNATSKPPDCGDDCSCTQVINVPLGSVVEVTVVDDTILPDLSHPFHLHGYAFSVIAMGRPQPEDGQSTFKPVMDLVEKGLLYRRNDSPAAKDTVTVPNQGYVVFRFRADNPGYWLFHCHFIYHLATGMDVVFHVGEKEDVPPTPHGFPTCGNHLPPIRTK